MPTPKEQLIADLLAAFQDVRVDKTPAEAAAQLAEAIEDYTVSPGAVAHDQLEGLLDDDHTIHPLLAGRSGGQTLIGDTAAGGDLHLQSTAHATRGKIYLGGAWFDEATGKLHLGNNVVFEGAAPVLEQPAGSSGNRLLANYHATWLSQQAAVAADYDFVLDTIVERTAGHLFAVQNNGAKRFSVDFAGKIYLPTQGATGGFRLGTDVDFFRSAANVASLGPGDSLDLILGEFTQASAASLFQSLACSHAIAQWRVANTAAASTANEVQLQMYGKTDAQARAMVQLVASYTGIADATRTSRLKIVTQNAGAVATALTIIGTKAKFYGDVVVGAANNVKQFFGAAENASISYDGTDLKINPQVVGSGKLDIQGKVKTTGRIVRTTRVASSPYNILSTDEEIFVDTDGGAITVNLPAGVNGTRYRIINCGSGANDVTITPNGAQLLTGANSSKTIADGLAIILTYETTEGWW